MANTIIVDHDRIVLQEPTALAKAIERCQRINPTGTNAIHVFPRGQGMNFPTWLEWHLVTNCSPEGNFVRGQSMLVAQIQRQTGADFEYHS